MASALITVMWQRIRQLVRSQKGFTFMETILTTVVLSVGFYGAMAIMQNAAANSVSSDFRIMATQLSGEGIETVLADKSFRGYDYIDAANYPSETLSGVYAGFTRTTTILEVDPTDLETPMASSGCKKVDVAVVWGQGGAETISMSTIVAEYTE